MNYHLTLPRVAGKLCSYVKVGGSQKTAKVFNMAYKPPRFSHAFTEDTRINWCRGPVGSNNSGNKELQTITLKLFWINVYVGHQVTRNAKRKFLGIHIGSCPQYLFKKWCLKHSCWCKYLCK